MLFILNISINMKSLNFHTEMSILTFLLLWTVAQFSLFCHSEELKDVQVKIIKEAKKPCNEDPSRMAERGNVENLILFKNSIIFMFTTYVCRIM